MRLTKNDMARVIIQALWNKQELPSADDEKVLKMAKRKKIDLAPEHEKAVDILLRKC